MQSLKRLFNGPRSITILVIAVLVIAIGTTSIYAASYVLNHSVDMTVNVGPSGGGSSPTPTPTSALIYSDQACTNPLTSAVVGYNAGTNNVLTAYVKAAEVTSVQATPALTGTLSNLTITAALGNTIGSARELLITTSGGSASTSYTGSATFQGSGQ